MSTKTDRVAEAWLVALTRQARGAKVYVEMERQDAQHLLNILTSQPAAFCTQPLAETVKAAIERR